MKISATGWLFDLYTQRNRMVLWFITDAGERLRLLDTFMPSFFVGLESHSRAERVRLQQTIRSLPAFEAVGRATRLDFWSDKPCEVGEIRVTDLDQYARNLRVLARKHPDWTYYNCDIPPEVHYCYERGVFPTARCAIEAEGDELLECRILDAPLDTDYPALPLRKIRLKAVGVAEGAWPCFRSLRLEHEAEVMEWDCDSPRDVLLSLNAQLTRIDPDLIFTQGGDSIILPALFALARQCQVPLALDREPGIERRIERDGTSYMSYGRILYHAPDYPLFGRWHIDEYNALLPGETGLHGLLEVARMGKIPLQRVARRSLGTGISSIQMDIAYRGGYLIPWKKSQPEAWKSAALMIKADRGGLVYQPITGVYEDVVELDFVSMYPSIMARYNVSPETINCQCCPPAPAVPELGYGICQRRKGLVAKAVAPVIDKRRVYKKRMKEARAAGDEPQRVLNDGRQEALKGLLVCCFGYLGYRNARFGRIEAHESTCAFSREILLRAREIAEDANFHVIHAIVDCVWIQKKKPALPSPDDTKEQTPSAPNGAAAPNNATTSEYSTPSAPNDATTSNEPMLLAPNGATALEPGVTEGNPRKDIFPLPSAPNGATALETLTPSAPKDATASNNPTPSAPKDATTSGEQTPSAPNGATALEPGVTEGNPRKGIPPLPSAPQGATATTDEIESLCREIERDTNIDIAVEGRYRWIAFLPSRENPDLPVPNRYFGRFSDGRMKVRGIEVRRSDQPLYVQKIQQQLLDRLAQTESLAECRAAKSELLDIVRQAEARLRHRDVPFSELSLRRRMSMEAEEYSGNNMTAVAARQARRVGMNLHPGETIQFIVLNQKAIDPDSRLRLVTLLQPEDTYDTDFYIEQVRRAAATVLEPLLGKTLERLLELPPTKPKRRPRRPIDPVIWIQLDLFDDYCEAS